jgi:ABC-type transporter Mla subunit MlaD
VPSPNTPPPPTLRPPSAISSRTTTPPPIDDALDIVKQIFGHGGQLPCTLLVVDEIQQFIGEKIQRANDVQEIAEHCLY